MYIKNYEVIENAEILQTMLKKDVDVIFYQNDCIKVFIDDELFKYGTYEDVYKTLDNCIRFLEILRGENNVF